MPWVSLKTMIFFAWAEGEERYMPGRRGTQIVMIVMIVDDFLEHRWHGLSGFHGPPFGRQFFFV